MTDTAQPSAGLSPGGSPGGMKTDTKKIVSDSRALIPTPAFVSEKKMEEKAMLEISPGTGRANFLDLSPIGQNRSTLSITGGMSATGALRKTTGRSPLKPLVYNRPQLSKEEERAFQDFFEVLDVEKSGLVAPSEALAVLKTFKWREDEPMLLVAVTENLNRPEFRDGLSYPQFLGVFTSALIANQTREQVQTMFNIIDEDESGSIRLEDLLRLVKEIGESVSLDELREMIKFSSNGNNEIPFEDFFSIFKKGAI